MISRNDLNTYLDELLDCRNFNDYAPNGLQIEGGSSIQRICTAVTASLDVIEQASILQADALLVHHGYFWKGENPLITGVKRKRIGKLIERNMSLFAYHLPLDCHVELGNNACLAKLFELKEVKAHQVDKVANLLWSGKFSTTKSIDDFTLQIENRLGQAPVHIQGSEKNIQQIAWCSGAAQDYLQEAYDLGADAYISGEISERTFYQAKELGIHYFACGHHATERYGIQELGKHLAQKFSLEHHFIDSNNPI